jgi:hypothetical protein
MLPRDPARAALVALVESRVAAAVAVAVGVGVAGIEVAVGACAGVSVMAGWTVADSDCFVAGTCVPGKGLDTGVHAEDIKTNRTTSKDLPTRDIFLLSQ